MESERFDESMISSLDVPRVGQMIVGNVVSVNKEGIFLDINYKSEGIIPASEIPPDELLKIKKGKEMKAVVMGFDRETGLVRLSLKEAEKQELREILNECVKKRLRVKGKITEKVKGGFSVELTFQGFRSKVEAFMPFSQADLKDVKEERLVGMQSEFIIIDSGGKGKIPVVSRKEYLLEVAEEKKKELFRAIEKGETISARVISVRDFGVFLDYGGVEIFVKREQISRKRFKEPKEVIRVGDLKKLKILEYNEKRNRFLGSIKEAEPDPWDNIEKIVKVGDEVKGTVTGITKFGAFVEIKEGVEGLIHLSELSWSKKIKKVEDILKEGDSVKCVLINIDREKKRISLSLRQALPNPWEEYLQKNPPGTRVRGRVSGANYSKLFISLSDEVEGFVRREEISWEKNVDPREKFKNGEEVEAVIIGGNPQKREIYLSIKQLLPDPWKEASKKFPPQSIVKGTVTTVTEKGVFVKLDEFIEGFLPRFETMAKKDEKMENLFKRGDEVECLVIESDARKRKITLSVKKLEKLREKEALEKIMGASKGLPGIGEAFKKAFQKSEKNDK